MRVEWNSFWTEKAGNKESEYEDAYWPRQPASGIAESNPLRFAVADGATETVYSSKWAKLLVRAYGHGKIERKRVLASLQSYQCAWIKNVQRQPLPWYVEQKVAEGAFASLLGLTFRNITTSDTRGTWVSLAVGDSCLVQVRGDQRITAFPYQHSSEFNSRPLLLSTKEANNARILEEGSILEGTWQRGDYFYLMTDALAAWFMQMDEARERPGEILNVITQRENFCDWVKDRRDAKMLKNDDTTLVRVKLLG